MTGGDQALDNILRSAAELGVEMDEHIQVVIDALEERSGELGLGPRDESSG